MVEAKGEYDWNHTSSIMALIINVNRSANETKAVDPADINPYTCKEDVAKNAADIEAGLMKLKADFLGR